MTIKPIHHATVARAEKAGITQFGVSENGDSYFLVTNAEVVLLSDNAKRLLDFGIVANKCENEYPALHFSTVYYNKVWAYVVDHESTDQIETRVWDADEPPTFSDLLETCADEGVDPEEGLDDEDEEDRSGDIVASKYREEYAARGNPANCGDWLAGVLEEQCHTAQKKFDTSLFEDLLIKNGVPMDGKWARQFETQTRGWQGRVRMSGRIRLEVIIAIRGTMFTVGPDNAWHEIKPDAGWLSEMRSKHAKAYEKAIKEAGDDATGGEA